MGEKMAKQEVKPAERSISESGVDLTLIRRYLAMTPTEPLRAWYNAARLALILELRNTLPDPQNVRETLVDRLPGMKAG